MPALADTVAEGFEGYRAFAPAGWEPPPPAHEEGELRRRLAQSGGWAAVAEVDGRVAGHAAFVPAELSRPPNPPPGFAHLWQLFVRRPHWGSGVAPALLAAAVGAAAQRGFGGMRLFTPAGQARARRFYEREGFATVGVPVFVGELGLELVEFQRPLAGPRDGG